MVTPLERPRVVTVFGVLCLVFAALGILGSLMAIPMMFGLTPPPNDPVNNLIYGKPGYMLYSKISLVTHLVACMVLIAIGIGLLKFSPWARRCAIGYGIYALVSGLIGYAFATTYLYIPLWSNTGADDGPAQFVAYLVLIGAVFGMVLGLGFPSLMIYFLTRPNAVQAFERRKN